MKISLQIPKNKNGSKAVWSQSDPFVLNSRAVLIHRPRRVSVYQILNRPSHLAIEYWCGNTQTGNDKFSFIAEPPEDRLVCHSCEQRAVMFGEMPSSEIVGRHVHTGKLKAVKTCCND